MTPRVQIHLKAADLHAGREFYRQFFGCEPVKDKIDQVKFLPDLAPLNLTISPARGNPGEAPAVNHLGIEVSSRGEIEQHLGRVKRAGIKVREQLSVNCCYA